MFFPYLLFWDFPFLSLFPEVLCFFYFYWILLFLLTNQNLSYKFTWSQSLASYYKSPFSGHFYSLWQGTKKLKVRSLSPSLSIWTLFKIYLLKHGINSWSQFWLLHSLLILIFIYNGIKFVIILESIYNYFWIFICCLLLFTFLANLQLSCINYINKFIKL